MSLKESKCEACTIDAPLVSDHEAIELLKELDNCCLLYTSDAADE